MKQKQKRKERKTQDSSSPVFMKDVNEKLAVKDESNE